MTSQPDMWNGKPLSERGVAYTDLNYRLYDCRTGALLSFNTTNSVDAIVTDVLRTQQENPDAVICGVEFDGPAWPDARRSPMRAVAQALLAPLSRFR